MICLVRMLYYLFGSVFLPYCVMTFITASANTIDWPVSHRVGTVFLSAFITLFLIVADAEGVVESIASDLERVMHDD